MKQDPKQKRKRGRPKGSGDRRTVQIAVEAALQGITPIEVMLQNMRFAHNEAMKLVKDLNKMLEKGDTIRERDVDGGVVIESVVDVYRESVRMRSMAQDCARDAAPYIHPRYATIQLTDEDESPANSIPGIIKRVLIDPKKQDSKKA